MNKKRVCVSDAELRSAIEKLKKAKRSGPLTWPVRNYPLLNEFIRRGRAKIENGVVVILNKNGKAV